jgi:hypothetical protein
MVLVPRRHDGNEIGDGFGVDRGKRLVKQDDGGILNEEPRANNIRCI